jgi:murein tripeptide amidase MpaA
MAGYLRTADVNAKLDAAVAAHPDVATRGSWEASHEGRSAGFVKIAATTAASPSPRWAVLVIGGVHARELAPPDALVSFVEKLLAAYAAGTDIAYPAWTGPGGVVYDAFTVSAGEVRSIVERLDLFVAPLVNPDGRDWVLAPLPAGASRAVQKLHKEWRKNRRPKPAGVTDERGVGVDLNRNFDILFKFQDHYDVAVAGVHTSTDPLEDDYCGTAAESEPETRNVAKLLRDHDISYFLDVHSFSRKVLYSWGIEDNQTTDASMAFTNPRWGLKRDGIGKHAYREFIPSTQEAAAADLARRMTQAIETRAGGTNPVAVARSRYEAKPSGAGLYVTTGSSDDYGFSRWFTAARAGRPTRPVIAMTMEAGDDATHGANHDDGGFSPGYVTQYPKVEREIHAALWSFLTSAAATPVAPAGPPPGPDLPADKICFVATAVYRDAQHPSVAFLRDVRDRQLPASGPGRRFAARLTDAYDSAGPPLARWLARHPAAARVTRGAVLEPAVRGLRALSVGTARFPRARSLALSATLGVTVWPVVASLRALRRARTA